jgi:hypothetical protein
MAEANPDPLTATAPSLGHRPLGRRKGTTYDWIDAPRYDEMAAILERHEAKSLSDAAGMVMHKAWGFGMVGEGWLKRRLVEGFRRNRST